MAYYFILLPHRTVGLVVFICSGPEPPNILTPLSGFLIKIVGLLASLIDKVAAQGQVARLLGGMSKFDQGQFDLGVAAVAALLSRLGTKNLGDMIRVATDNI